MHPCAHVCGCVTCMFNLYRKRKASCVPWLSHDVLFSAHMPGAVRATGVRASGASFWSCTAVTSELTGARTHGLGMNVAALCILFRPADFNETSDRHMSCFRVKANIHGSLGRPVFGNGGDSFYLIHIQSLFNKSILI